MSINFVIGPPCSGKSYFIENTFSKDSIIIDLWDYQKDLPYFNVENITESYELAKKDLIRKIQNNPDKQIIFEHTLLKSIRRKPYLDAIREITSDEINCYVIKPNMWRYKKNCKLRKLDYKFEKDAFKMLEIPTKSEGFNNIYIINAI